MPNHFHFLVKKKNIDSMQKFIRSLLTRYSMYFNKKYERVGSLFQGPYKAVLVSKDEYLLHLSRYIHLNPNEYTNNLIEAYSSYAEYLGKRKTKWIKPKIVLSFFSQAKLPYLEKLNTYKNFVEGCKRDSKLTLGELVLD